MTITPNDIQKKQFERAFRGYEIEDVDDFLDQIARDLEQLMRENTDLKDQVEQLKEKNKSYQKMEETMHNAIVVAQETAEEVKQNAKREAELIKKEAERDAKQVLEDSRCRISKLLVEHEELLKRARVFKMRFRSFMESQLVALDSESWLEEQKPYQQIVPSNQDNEKLGGLNGKDQPSDPVSFNGDKTISPKES